MGAGELARAPMKSCFFGCSSCFHYKGGSVKNRDAPTIPKNRISRLKPAGEWGIISPSYLRKGEMTDYPHGMVGKKEEGDRRWQHLQCCSTERLLRCAARGTAAIIVRISTHDVMTTTWLCLMCSREGCYARPESSRLMKFTTLSLLSQSMRRNC
jgi:hypothetical protein